MTKETMFEELRDVFSKEELNQIMYHLIYRNINPKTLELLVVGYQMGRK